MIICMSKFFLLKLIHCYFNRIIHLLMSNANEKMVFEYFLGLLGQIKVFHWTTMSYSSHKALDELHGKLSDLVDEFVEVFMGKFNKQPSELFTITMNATSDSSDIIGYLEEQRELIRGLRNKYFKTSSEIQNIIDTMMSNISNAIYLCRLK